MLNFLGNAGSGLYNRLLVLSEIGKLLVLPYNASASIAYVTQDGINWTQKNLPYSKLWGNMFVFFKNKLSLIVPSEKKIYVTDNLSSYTEQTISSSTNLDVYSLAVSPERAVLPVTGGVLYSNDGSTWTKALITNGSEFSGYFYIAYGNGKYIIPLSSSSVAYISNTGISDWTEISLPNEIEPNGIAFGNNTFILSARDKAGFGFGV